MWNQGVAWRANENLRRRTCLLRQRKRPSPAKDMPGGCAPAMPGAASSSGLVAAAAASPSSMAVSLRAPGDTLPSTSMRRFSIRIYAFGLTLGRVSFGEDMPEDVLRGYRKITKHMKYVEHFDNDLLAYWMKGRVHDSNAAKLSVNAVGFHDPGAGGSTGKATSAPTLQTLHASCKMWTAANT